MPGQYAGGIGDEGAQALRDFVTAGGTLVTLGNAASFAIDQFNLPVTERAGRAAAGPVLLLRLAAARGNRGPQASRGGRAAAHSGGDVRAQPGVRHPARRSAARCWPSYLKDRNPLVSGYLLGAEAIQGKAAALDANYGSGHIIMLGFRPQWRGQSHGTYKFLFNALYYNPSMAPETRRRAAGAEARGRRESAAGGVAHARPNR